MSLAHDLYRAHRARVARIEAAARKAAAVAQAKALEASPPVRRVVALPPNLIRLLTSPDVERMPADTDSILAIAKAVGHVFGVPASEILGRSEKKQLALPRHICNWAAVLAIENASWVWLGREFGRHHATVIYAYKKIEAEKTKHQKAISEISIAIGLPLADMTKPHLLELKTKNQSGGSDARKNEPCQSGRGAKPLGTEGGAEGRCAGYGKRKPRRKPRAAVRLAPAPKAGGSSRGEADQGKGAAREG